MSSLSSQLTWHADALEAATFVDAGSLVEAGIVLALVNIVLATVAAEAGRTVATIRARRVDANSAMLTRRLVAT